MTLNLARIDMMMNVFVFSIVWFTYFFCGIYYSFSIFVSTSIISSLLNKLQMKVESLNHMLTMVELLLVLQEMITVFLLQIVGFQLLINILSVQGTFPEFQ